MIAPAAAPGEQAGIVVLPEEPLSKRSAGRGKATRETKALRKNIPYFMPLTPEGYYVQANFHRYQSTCSLFWQCTHPTHCT